MSSRGRGPLSKPEMTGQHRCADTFVYSTLLVQCAGGPPCIMQMTAPPLVVACGPILLQPGPGAANNAMIQQWHFVKVSLPSSSGVKLEQNCCVIGSTWCGGFGIDVLWNSYLLDKFEYLEYFSPTVNPFVTGGYKTAEAIKDVARCGWWCCNWATPPTAAPTTSTDNVAVWCSPEFSNKYVSSSSILPWTQEEGFGVVAFFAFSRAILLCKEEVSSSN